MRPQHDPSLPTVTYSPRVFDVPDEAAARRIILTPEHGEGTQERWVRETPYLAPLAGAQLDIKASDLIVDFGCGIGRIAKEMIARFGCSVLGVDISPSMRALAPGYVASERFSVVSADVFGAMVERGFRAEHAVAIWVLQHVRRPAEDIDLLARGLKPGGGLFVVNLKTRAIPTAEHGWVDDRKDVRALLDERLTPIQAGTLTDAIVPKRTAETTFWARYAAS